MTGRDEAREEAAWATVDDEDFPTVEDEAWLHESVEPEQEEEKRGRFPFGW